MEALAVPISPVKRLQYGDVVYINLDGAYITAVIKNVQRELDLVTLTWVSPQIFGLEGTSHFDANTNLQVQAFSNTDIKSGNGLSCPTCGHRAN